MSLAHRRAVVAGLVTGGFLLAGLSVSTQEPAFASAGTASPSPPGRGQHEARPQRLQLTKPITAEARIACCLALDGRARAHRQLNLIRIADADVHTQPDSLRISDPHAEPNRLGII